MRDIWVISDTHFKHSNIIRYCGRPFDDTDEMDDYIIHQWNSVVKDQDYVYHLGDVSMGDVSGLPKILGKLKGHKRLILGNHDDGKSRILPFYFEKITMWRNFSLEGLLFTHVPVHESSLIRAEKNERPVRLFNVHGHIHDKPSPEGPYKCVCVEQIDYTPVHFDELISLGNKFRTELNNDS